MSNIKIGKTEEDNYTYFGDFIITKKVLQKEYDNYLKQVSKHIEVPGFRKGKTPTTILKNFMEKEGYEEDFEQYFIDKNYQELFGLLRKFPETKGKTYIDAMIVPEIETEGEVSKIPFLIRTVGGALDLRKMEIPTIHLTNGDLWKNLPSGGLDNFKKGIHRNFLAKNSPLSSSSKPAKIGDLLTVTGEITLKKNNSNPIEKWENEKIVLGTNFEYPGFDKKLLDITAGKKKKFTFKIPQKSHSKMAGSELVARVSIIKVEKPKYRNLEKYFKNEKNDEFKNSADFKQGIDKLFHKAVDQVKYNMFVEKIEKYLLETIPDFEILEDEFLEAEANEIFEQFKKDDENKNLENCEIDITSVGNYFNPEPPKNSTTKQKILFKLKNKHRLKYILIHLFNLYVKNMDMDEEIEEKVDRILKNPENFGFEKNIRREIVYMDVKDRHKMTLAMHYLVDKINEKNGNTSKDYE